MVESGLNDQAVQMHFTSEGISLISKLLLLYSSWIKGLDKVFQDLTARLFPTQ